MAVDALARALAAGKVPVSAYEMAVKAGYTGTEEQFAEDMGNSGTNSANAAASAEAAAASAESVADSAAQIAKNTSDISDLTTQINSVANLKVNLFDKTSATLNQKMQSNGTPVDETGTLFTDYFPISRGKTYTTLYYQAIGSYNLMVLYSNTKSRAGSVTGVRNGDYVSYTVPDNSDIYAYGIINNAVANLDTLMIVEGSEYPTQYSPYNTITLNDSVPLSGTQEEQVDAKVSPLATESPNMFNKNSDDLLNGYYSSGFVANDIYRMTHVFALKAGKSYKYKHSLSMGGNYQVPYTNKDGDFIGGYLVGTNSNGIVTLVPNNDCYVRVNIGRAIQTESFMFTESDKYPSEYKPWGQYTGANLYPSDRFKHPNLTGKIIVFDGDSICAGDHDTEGVKGYAQRIGTDAGMEWQNVAVGGATIAEVSGVSHNLCTYIDTIHTSNLYNALDYLILEGGTNDAAHLGDLGADGLGTLTDQNNNSGPYDEETFYGALETLFYKATQYFPNKKIGFIIAMKMAGWSDSANKMVIPAHRAEYFDAARLACEKWGIPYLDLWKTCIMNPCTEAYYDHSMTEEQNLAAGKMYADGQHPNSIGYDFLSPIIENWIATL